MEQTSHSQYFHVEGIRCVRCIHAIESALQGEKLVTSARVNMSTNRLAVSWQGDENLADKFSEKIESLGYKVKPFEAPKIDKSEDKFLLRCVAISGFAMGNIMLISVVLWSSSQEVMGLATRDLLHWISSLIALPTVAYAGQPFFISASSFLKKGKTNMDVPISLALILACGMSLFETINHGEHAYFDSAVMLLFFLLIGRWLDASVRGKARENAEILLSLMQGNTTIIERDKQRSIPISELVEGMKVQIAVGEKVPTDCEVIKGKSEIDTSLVTGETLPSKVKEGDIIYGGTINLSSPIMCKVIKASEDSLLADIIRLMENAEQGRAQYVRLADKAAQFYTPIVHILAAGAFVWWFLIYGMAWQDALLIAITTLIITCPCALGLAVPVVQVLASSWLMKRGILLKASDALERLAKIDTAIFDKTGTLTLGRPILESKDSDANFKLAASLASHSKHPYSQAISKAYNRELIKLDNVQEITAVNVSAVYEGKKITLGKYESEIKKDSKNYDGPQIWFSIEGEEPVAFNFIDPLREDSKIVINEFKKIGITIHLLSGDDKNTAQQVAENLEIEHWQGCLLPAEKTKTIKELQRNGSCVLMVGDGLNDAPSLAQADISISPATGMDITQNIADIVFQGDKLISVLQSFKMAQLTTKLVKQNFALAVIYNLIAIPIALMGLVTPLIAAIAMSSSSLIVIANSFRINFNKG